MGQGSGIFPGWDRIEDPFFALQHLAGSLKPLQKCYASTGGLVGYQLIVFKLLQKKSLPASSQMIVPPVGLSIEDENKETLSLVQAGIEHLPNSVKFTPWAGQETD